MSDSKRRRGQGVLVAGWMIALAGVWVGTQRSAYGETGDRNMVASLSASVSAKLRKYIPHKMWLPTSYRPKKYTAKQMGTLPKYPKRTMASGSIMENLHICVVTTHHNVYCWGGKYGGKMEKLNIGVPVDEIVVGSSSNDGCVLLTSKDVRCWGGNAGYDESITDIDAMRKKGNVPVGGKVKQVAKANDTVCVVLDNGHVRCWGDNAFGALGYPIASVKTVGDGKGPSILAAGDVAIGGKAKSISTNGIATCVVMESGGVRCWGNGEVIYEHSDKKFEMVHKRKPTIAERGDIPLSGKAVQVVVGPKGIYVLLEDGRVQCLSNFGYGKTLYDGSSQEMGELPLPEPAIQLMDEGHCAILKSGKMSCWWNWCESNPFNTLYRYEPPKIRKPQTMKFPPPLQRTGDYEAQCAQNTSGKIVCWGIIGVDSGILGYPTPPQWVVPARGSAWVPYWKSRPVPIPEPVRKPYLIINVSYSSTGFEVTGEYIRDDWNEILSNSFYGNLPKSEKGSPTSPRIVEGNSCLSMKSLSRD
jgi:hypothetical protein